MAKFQYYALKNNTKIVKGEVEASSLRDAREQIRNLGFIPTKVYLEEDSESRSYACDNLNSDCISFLSLQDKILFTSELQVMLSSGIPIVEALQIIENNVEKRKIKSICHNLKKSITSGKTLEESFSSLYLDVFGPVYLALIKSGEFSGELDVTLERILVLLRKQERIRNKIIGASIYPVILICIMAIVLIVFTKVIFPALYGALSFSGEEVPIIAQMLINLCTFIDKFWWFLIVSFLAIGYAIKLALKNQNIKLKFDNFLLKVPILSNFIQYVNLSNFMSVLHISYEAGIPIISGLELASFTVKNKVINGKILKSKEKIRNGMSLSEAFGMEQALPNALLTMIITGEKSGSLGKMLKEVADVIDKKVDIALEALAKSFEPTLIIIMGVLVLFIAVAFAQMYYSVIGSLF